jgi:hypothetical protein
VNPTDFRLSLARESRERATQQAIDEEAAKYAESLRRQLQLVSDYRFRVVCFGPPEHGWPRRASIFYRCLNCGYLMRSDADEYDACFCGAMRRDLDAGRFGSQFGDRAIETLEVIE